MKCRTDERNNNIRNTLYYIAIIIIVYTILLLYFLDPLRSLQSQCETTKATSHNEIGQFFIVVIIFYGFFVYFFGTMGTYLLYH